MQSDQGKGSIALVLIVVSTFQKDKMQIKRTWLFRSKSELLEMLNLQKKKTPHYFPSMPSHSGSSVLLHSTNN